MNLAPSTPGTLRGNTLTSALLRPPLPAAGHHAGPASRITSEPPASRLSPKLLACIVKHAPLVVIDLLVQNALGEVLLGLRRHPPARGYWFVPEGRVLKNEPVEQAVRRIAGTELSLEQPACRAATLIGMFEHRYQDNFTGAESYGTHHIVLAHRLVIQGLCTLTLPRDQLIGYRWLRTSDLATARDVHPYARAYATHI